MRDPVLDKAHLRLEELEKEASEIRTFIRMYTRFSDQGLATMERPLETKSAKPTETTKSLRPQFASQTEPHRFSTRDEIVEAARKVLREAHPEPVLIGDLYETLLRRGVRISGKNPKGNLSAKLAPPDDIVFVRDKGWYFRPKKNEGSTVFGGAFLVRGGDDTPS
ncbi:MAG: hypothetical protein ACFB03_20450 [Paracoccaceae bacterium]